MVVSRRRFAQVVRTTGSCVVSIASMSPGKVHYRVFKDRSGIELQFDPNLRKPPPIRPISLLSSFSLKSSGSQRLPASPRNIA